MGGCHRGIVSGGSRRFNLGEPPCVWWIGSERGGGCWLGGCYGGVGLRWDSCPARWPRQAGLAPSARPRLLAANSSLLDISLHSLTTLPSSHPPKMFTRGARPALTVARTASKQQQAGMATLKEIDQRCVSVARPSRSSIRQSRPATLPLPQRAQTSPTHARIPGATGADSSMHTELC